MPSSSAELKILYVVWFLLLGECKHGLFGGMISVSVWWLPPSKHYGSYVLTEQGEATSAEVCLSRGVDSY